MKKSPQSKWKWSPEYLNWMLDCPSRKVMGVVRKGKTPHGEMFFGGVLDECGVQIKKDEYLVLMLSLADAQAEVERVMSENHPIVAE